MRLRNPTPTPVLRIGRAYPAPGVGDRNAIHAPHRDAKQPGGRRTRPLITRLGPSGRFWDRASMRGLCAASAAAAIRRRAHESLHGRRTRTSKSPVMTAACIAGRRLSIRNEALLELSGGTSPIASFPARRAVGTGDAPNSIVCEHGYEHGYEHGKQRGKQQRVEQREERVSRGSRACAYATALPLHTTHTPTRAAALSQRARPQRGARGSPRRRTASLLQAMRPSRVAA